MVKMENGMQLPTAQEASRQSVSNREKKFQRLQELAIDTINRAISNGFCECRFNLSTEFKDHFNDLERVLQGNGYSTYIVNDSNGCSRMEVSW